MTRLLLIPVFFIALLAGAILWSGGSAQKRAEFAFLDRGDVYTLDLNQISYMQDFRLSYGIREGLYSPDPQTLRPAPAGAVSHEISDDKRVLTFKLRPEARWDNGDPVTAHDYVFSWRRMLQEPGEYTYLFFYFLNAEDYQKSYASGKPLDFKTVGIEALDDHTLRVKLKDPVTYLLDILAFPVFYPRHEKSMRPFRSFTDVDVMDRLTAYLNDLAKVAESKASEEAKQAFTSRTTGFSLETADEKQVLDVLTAFAPLKPFDEATEAATAQKLQHMAEMQFVRTSYRADYTRPAASKGAPGVVTNGPYTMKLWDFKRRVILEKSETYWDRDKVSVKRIEKVVNDNPLSQFLLYESGAVDWMSDVPGDLAAELFARGRTDLKTSPAFGTMFMTLLRRPNLPDSLGGGKNPLADVRVRQALAMSVDKQFIVKHITRMGELPARTYLPPDGTLPDFRWAPGPYDTARTADQPYTDKEIRALLVGPPTKNGPGLPYDIETARKLLAEAGYPDGRGFPVLPILSNTDNAVRSKIAQALKTQWKAALNIDITLQTLEGKIFKERVSKKDYAIATVAWYGDYPDASTYTDKYLSTSLQNDSDYKNPAYDALCIQAQSEGDPVARTKLLSQAENLLDTEVPIIPMYHYVNTGLFRDNVKGIWPNPRSLTVFKAITVEK